MTLLELAAFVLAFGAIVSRLAFRWIEPWLLGASAIALASALALNPARWQLLSAVIGLGLLVLVLRQPVRFGRKSAIAGVVLLGLAAVLAQTFSMPRLAAPLGPYAVGTVTDTLVRREGRAERRLFLKIWYPASNSRAEPEGLWSDLPGMTDIPWYFRWGLAYLTRAPTHSHPAARYGAGAGPARIVLYNHSFVSWASENSLLAEDLASRGYTVIAIRHLGQVDEYREGGRALGEIPTADMRLAGAIMRRRTDDSRFVADRLGPVLQAVPQLTGRVPATYAAMGFSLGGAVSSDLCVTDRRCRAVVNIDGAIPGVDYTRLPTPHYLMVKGSAHAGEDAVRAGGYEEVIYARAAHADFLDAAITLPITRWFFGRSVEELARERRRQTDLIASFLARAGR